MSLFKKTREIAIDLGTANTIISVDGKIVVEEPSVVLQYDSKYLATGHRGLCLHVHNPDACEYIWPLKGGIVNDFEGLSFMVKDYLGRIILRHNYLFSHSIRMRICAPRPARDAVSEIIGDFKKWNNILVEDCHILHYESDAVALALGVNPSINPAPLLLVDIGGTVTNIAYYSNEGHHLKCSPCIAIGGCQFTQDIHDYLREQRSIIIGRAAESVKREVGSAVSFLDTPPEDYAVQGWDAQTNAHKEISVSYKEIASCLEKSINAIEVAVRQTLEQMPQAEYNYVAKRGIHLTGGGALLRGLADCLSERIGIKFVLAEDPLHMVIKGVEIGIKKSYRLFYSNSEVEALNKESREKILIYLEEINEDVREMMSDGSMTDEWVKSYSDQLKTIPYSPNKEIVDYKEMIFRELKEYSEKKGYDLEKIFGK